MREKVTISLHNSTFQGGQKDEWTALEQAWLTPLETGYSLLFKLHRDDASDVLIIATPTYLSMTRSSKGTTSVFYFSPEGIHPVQYQTHYGSFPMEAKTRKYIYSEDGFVLEYDILVQGEPSGTFNFSLFFRKKELSA